MLVVCRAGTSNIDLDAAKRNNVIVVNTPGRNAVGVGCRNDDQRLKKFL